MRGDGIVQSGYQLDDCDLIPSGGMNDFFLPSHPEQLWGPYSLLSSGYWGLYPQRYSNQGVKLSIHPPSNAKI